jgi:hypothetical protein
MADSPRPDPDDCFHCPKATSPAQSPTTPEHGSPSSLPSQQLQARTAPTVLTRSIPASSRPSANCTRPWPTTPGDLASLPADIERRWVAGGGASCRRDDPEIAAGPDPSPSPPQIAHQEAGDHDAAGRARITRPPYRYRPPGPVLTCEHGTNQGASPSVRSERPRRCGSGFNNAPRSIISHPLPSWSLSSRPIASAATACIVAVTCEYKSKVIPIWLWPSRSLTILGCTPSPNSRVAQL